MSRTLLIDALHPEETRVAIVDSDSVLQDFDCEFAGRKQITGNIYLAKIVRVEPSLQAAFIEYGAERQGFLSFNDIHPDFYHKTKRAADEDSSVVPVRRIQEAVRRRQLLTVQASKEERGNKGAAFTTYISLPGRYSIYMPNMPGSNGVSRKIPGEERQRLKDLLENLPLSESESILLRSAGADRTKLEIKRDYEYLAKLWEEIKAKSLEIKEPGLIYEEDNLIKRAVRDMYGRDTEAVYVQGESAYREAKEFMRMLSPSHAKNVHYYRENKPLFVKHHVEQPIENLFSPVVPLPSGGSLVIGHTEALVAIDVNSGRSTREASPEETAFKTNMEAAVELARQMRLRDLAGLIVIDFIDMADGNAAKTVEKRLKDALKLDRARLQIGKISNFGLLEMSRQRLRPGIADVAAASCPHCHGSGKLRTDESFALSVLRRIADAAEPANVTALSVHTAQNVALYLLNRKRLALSDIERETGTLIEIHGEPNSAAEFCTINTQVDHTIALPQPEASPSTMPEGEEQEATVHAQAASAPASHHSAPLVHTEYREDGSILLIVEQRATLPVTADAPVRSRSYRRG